MSKSRSSSIQDNDLLLTKEISSSLKKSREELGLSRVEFSAETGVDRNTIYNLENKRLKRFGGNHLKKIVNFFKGHKKNTKISNFFSTINKNDEKPRYKSIAKPSLKNGRKDGMEVSNELKEMIKAARLNAGVSQNEMARAMGTSAQTYIKIENTKLKGNIGRKSLSAFANAASKLFKEEDYEKIKNLKVKFANHNKNKIQNNSKAAILKKLSYISDQISELTRAFTSIK